MDILANVIAIIILLFISFWVYRDAESRGMNAAGWAVFVFLLLIIGLPMYLLLRKPKIH